MATYRSWNLRCAGVPGHAEPCGHEFDDLVSILYIDDVETVCYPMCPRCGGMTEKGLQAPAIMSRALPDGTSRGDTYKMMKERSHLETAARRARDEGAQRLLTREVQALDKRIDERGKFDVVKK